MPHHTMFNHIMTHNANPNANSKMNMTTVRCPITNETTLAIYPVVHLTSTHPWDPSMLDAPNPYHSLARSMDHQLELQKVHKQKYYADGFFRSRCDQHPSTIKPMFEFDPYDKSYDKFFSLPLENGEQITKKGKRVLNTNFT